jgi:chemosensory pili system protein ChpA (sensor histidine kinase/response regulator)
MQNFDSAPTLTATDVQAHDLGPLAWVLDELRKSLDAATKALRRFVRDAEQARGSDLASVDTAQLRNARQQLHQAVGALEMVGFTQPAIVLRGMEAAVQKFVTKPELCTEAAAVKIERASFALTGYLETVLAGKAQSPITLFVQYADVQELAGAARVHPADLWTYPWRWINVADTGVTPMAINAETRSLFDRSALMVIKAYDMPAATELAQLSASIATPVNTVVDRQFSAFWRIAAGFFQAIATGSIPADVYVKRTVSRILTQLAAHTKGDMAVSDRLAQDLLFFCAQAKPLGLAPLLGEVRLSYGLAAHPPVNYTKSPFGQFDPILLLQARKRIASAKESWSGLAAGEMGRLKSVQDHFNLIVDSIAKLLPTGQALSKALTSVVETVVKTNQSPEPALGMEVATSILYLEAGFEDFDPSDTRLTDRINHLAQRVEKARQGATNQPLEPWMEELYRRVSDRQTMGSVVGELKNSLADLEGSMDKFFRDPQDKSVLANVPSRLAQMRGVLSVLGLDHASQTVLRMRGTVEQILETEVDDAQARAAGTFDKLGNNLGALGFLIDMLSYQPVLAKKLFVFDDERGELKPLMGRVNAPIPQMHVPSNAQAIASVAKTTLTAPSGSWSTASLSAVGMPAMPGVAVPAISTAAVLPSTVFTANTAPHQASSITADKPESELSDDDAELLDIFLEEAREVIGNGKTAVAALAQEPGNLEELTTLRRAFHTLKGSSRMVRLNAFGEAGWSYEQMLNAWLADQKPASEALCNTASQGLDGMARWVDDIAAHKAQAWVAAPFSASADALRKHGVYLPLQLGSAVKDPVAHAAPQPIPSIGSTTTLDPAAVTPVAVVVPLAASAAALGTAVLAAPLAAAVSSPAQAAMPMQAAEDLDFAFDLSLPDIEADAKVATTGVSTPSSAMADDELPLTLDIPEDALQAAMPSVKPDAPQIDLADIFSLDLSDTPGVAANNALPSAELQPAAVPPVVPAFQDMEIDESGELVGSSEDLVGQDELAAFERALQEQDIALAAIQAKGASPQFRAYAATNFEAPVIHLDSDMHERTPAGNSDPFSDSASTHHGNQNLTHADDMALFERALQEQDAAQAAMFARTDNAQSPAFAPTNFEAHEPQTSSLPPAPPPAQELMQFSVPAVAAASLASLGATVAAVAAVPVAQSKVMAAPTQALPSAVNSGFDGLAPDDQYKAVGPLRIGLALYNVYLNEADEWSRRLVMCLSEWSLDEGQALPGDAVVFAHSLAGSSATVGFNALSGLARTMEHALQHIQGISEDGRYAAHQHSAEFVGAAEEIRRLLHQFAAGLLREPLASVEEGLERCLAVPERISDWQTLSVDPVDSSRNTLEANGVAGPDKTAQEATKLIADDAIHSGFDSLSDTSSVTVIAAASVATAATVAVTTSAAAQVTAVPIVPVPLQTAVSVAASHVTQNFAAVGLSSPKGLSVVPRNLTEQEAEDEIDLLDAIDPDLFPIFEEEAQELLPQMGGALRQWSARPNNLTARSEVLRGLHTLKGSARLAGALRLGELAHRMESAIEQTPEEADAAQLEPLMGLLDGLQANFDRLRQAPSTLEDATSVTAHLGSTSTVSIAPAQATEPAASLTANQPTLVAVPASPLVAGAQPLRSSTATGSSLTSPVQRASSNQTVRVRSQLLDRLINQAGEVIITRTRLEAELSQLRGSLGDMTSNLDKLRVQLRDIEVQAESQMQSRMALAKETQASFDPLEFDRFTRVQELTRMMAESVNDVATVQRSIQRTVDATEDDLVAQTRQTRDLQRDLLRTRMVEFEGISERLYRVVRQAGKDAGKQVKLDITGGSIEMDRGVLDRMTPAFEHLLRNCVAHGIEESEARVAAGKDASGQITISLRQEGNDVSVEFRDDGAGLNLARIRERATVQGLLTQGSALDDNEAANLIFTAGFTTATKVTELSGRGIGMDVVRSEVVALGGRIETSTAAGKGTNFKLVLPLTTAVTQVVMLRVGKLSIGVPSNLVETVRRATGKEIQAAYNSGTYDYNGETLPFFWAGALLQHSPASDAAPSKSMPILVFRSAAQRIVAHVDEVLGNQEVVVKNLGPQLARLPGLAGMSVLASGAVALIYNPVALAAVYGLQARALSADKAEAHVLADAVTDVVSRDLSGDAAPVVPLVPANPRSVSAPQVPLILVVDDSITVRRVTQRLLQREGYRVALAADGILALAALGQELPAVVLSDIEMPRMDGFDLVRNMKADPRLAGLPVITITSRIAEKHREHALSLGVDHYLGKPYSEEELLSLIRRYTAVETTK